MQELFYLRMEEGCSTGILVRGSESSAVQHNTERGILDRQAGRKGKA